MSSRTFTTEVVMKATPWDVYELISDESQQRQWRDAHTGKHAIVMEAEPYTHVAFSDGVVYELQPEGTGTRVRATRTRHAEGFMAKAGLRLISKRSAEDDMRTDLKRIDSALSFGDL